MQAQNIVQEDDEDDVYIPDEAKYNALVESRKDRRAVSTTEDIYISVVSQEFLKPAAIFFTYLNFKNVLNYYRVSVYTIFSNARSRIR